MLHYRDTTVFNIGAQTIVNTVNCIGVMGAGLALECKLRFPEMYEDYVKRCQGKEVKVDRPYLYRGYQNILILNFATKNHWKYPSKIEWIEQGLAYFVDNYEREGIISIAFPKLGCDKGGLDWNEVKDLMEKYLKDLSIDVYICLDRESKATGIEGKMVEIINNKRNYFWISKSGIRNDIADKIIAHLPINRFREIQKIKGVGKETYEAIFKTLYSQVQNNNLKAKAIEIKRELNSKQTKQEAIQLTLPLEL